MSKPIFNQQFKNKVKFFDKLNQASDRNHSLLYICLDPNPEILPSSFGEEINISSNFWGIKEWLEFLIAETADLVCAYKLTLEFYRVLGSLGLELLRQILKAIPEDIPIILDAKYCGLDTSTIFARTIFSDWQVDAVTLNPYHGQDEVAPFLLYPEKAVFILCATDNPSASVLQKDDQAQSPYYLQLTREAKNWGTPEQVGLQLGGSTEVLAKIREIAPERMILATDLPLEDQELKNFLELELNSNGEDLIVPVPSQMFGEQFSREQVKNLREQVNQIRIEIAQDNPNCSLWMPDVCLLQSHPHKDLILQLYDIGCIHFGEYVQASGATFPYYIDLRTIISHPQVFEKVLAAYADILQNLSFDRIAGIPYGSLPTATGLGLRLNFPMIFPRKEVKAHGTRRLVEGKFIEGETIVVVDDILITGKSVMEGAEKLKSVGLDVEDIVVFIDHEEGVQDRLQANGYRGHAVLRMSEIAQILYEAGKLDEAQWQMLDKQSD